MIRGYLARDSVAAGAPLRVHVSTDSPRFRVELWRQGTAPQRVHASGWLPGCEAPVPAHPDGVAGRAHPALDWGWPGHALPTDAGWAPGIYVAELHADDGTDPWREGFVLRSPTPGSRSPILYKVATFTRHAYNQAGGASLYEHPVYVPPARAGEAFGHKVSMRRPGGTSHFDLWDVPFAGWLERNGYEVEFCADIDVHEDQGLLDAYALMLSVGHDEYWSGAMRSGVEAFVRGGGNVAFFGADTCWWRIHVTDDATAFLSDTDHSADGSASDQWWAPVPGGQGKPENALTGTSFRNAGVWPGWFTDSHPPRLGFTVQHAGHWVFDGTGLRDARDGGVADVLGAGVPLVGYECDGASYVVDGAGVARADGRDGTPSSFRILGIAVLQPVCEPAPQRFYEPSSGTWICAAREPGASSPRAATMGILTTGGGTVFCAATTNWPVVLGTHADPGVDRITRNVLDRLWRPG